MHTGLTWTISPIIISTVTLLCLHNLLTFVYKRVYTLKKKLFVSHAILSKTKKKQRLKINRTVASLTVQITVRVGDTQLDTGRKGRQVRYTGNNSIKSAGL